MTGHPWYGTLDVVTVPEWIASITPPGHSQSIFVPCYAFHTDRTASCAPELSRSVQPIALPTTVSKYPPPYYAIVGLPTLFMAGEPAVYAMRLLSSVLAVGLIGLGLAVASPTRRTWLALGAAVAFTPSAAHLVGGSVNPSGMEIGAAMGLGIGLLGIVAQEPRRGPKLAWLLVVLAFAVAWARPLTVATLVAVILAVVVLNTTDLQGWLRARFVRYVVIVGTALAALSAVAFRTLMLRIPSTPVLDQIFDVRSGVSRALPPSDSPGQILWELERRSFEISRDLIGELGWLDHSPPMSVILAWTLLVAALIVLAIAFGNRRDRIGLMLVGAGALIIAPLYVMLVVFGNAEAYQSRYHLPVATLLVLGAALILRRSTGGSNLIRAWTTLRWGAALVPLGMLMSLAASLFRYSVGAGGRRGDAVQLANMWDLVFDVHEWVPPGAALLGLVLLVGGAIALIRVTRDGPTLDAGVVRA